MGTLVGVGASSSTGSVTVLPGVAHPVMAVGDIEILAHASDQTQTLAIDALFASVLNLVDGSLRAYLGSNTADGTEAGSITISSTPTGNRQTACVAAFRDYAGIEPSTVVSLNETATDSSHDSPTLTPAWTNSCVVFVYYERTSNSTVPPRTPPAGLTKAVEFGTSGNGGTYVQIAYKLSGVVRGVAESPGPWASAVATGAAYVFALELIPYRALASIVFGRVRPDQLAGAVRDDQVHGDVRSNQVTGDVRSNQILGGNSVARTLSPGSVEVIWAEITFLGLTASAISAVTAQIAFTTTDTPPTSWQAADSTTRTDITGAAKLSVSKSVTAALQAGETSSTYRVWAKLSDGTIVPCEQYTVR